MKIRDVDFSYVLDHAARTCIGADDDDVRAVIHARARQWLTDNQVTVETWLAPPAVYDVRGLVYRRLLAHLHDYGAQEPADNRALTYVIAAGHSWDDTPERERFFADDHWTADTFCGLGEEFAASAETLTRWRAMIHAQRMQSRPGGVYLAYSETLGLHRIGRAKNVLVSVQAQRAAWPDVRIVCSVPFGGHMLHAYLCDRFKDRCATGEWFTLDGDGKTQFLNAIRSWGESNVLDRG